MKIKDIIKNFPEEERKELEKTTEACMESICCQDVQWQEFSVYESSVDMMKKVLENLAVEFLLPIAERARDESYREVLIIFSSTTSKTDEIWCVRVKPSQLYATIRLSPKTRAYLSEV